MLRETEAGNPVRTAYVHLDADPEEADSIIHKACVGMHLPETWHWMAQVVFWMGGSIALRRFLAVPEMVSLTEKQRIEAVQRFHAGLMEIETRFATEGRPIRFKDVPAHRKSNRSRRKWSRSPPFSYIKITFQNAEAVKDYIQDLFNQEKQAVAVLGIKPPRRPRDLWEYLFTIHERCNAWLEKGFKASSNRRIAGIAALCAMHSSAVPIPRNLVNSNADERPLTDFIRHLVKISAKPGYDGLLASLEDYNPFSRNSCYDFEPDVLRRLVLVGTSAEDLHWLTTHDHYTTDTPFYCVSTAFAEAGINPAPLRRLVVELAKLGSACKTQEINHALNLIAHQSKDIRPAELFEAWLAQFTKQRSDPAAARRIWHTFLDTLNLTGLGLQYQQLMDQWFSAKPLKDAFAGMITPEMDEQVLRQLELLARYQHLAGQEIRLTGSLKRLLEAEVRTRAELAYLEAQEAAGSLKEGATKRLNYLRISERSKPSVEKVLRKTVELSAITALEGLRKRIDEELQALWNRFVPGKATALSVNSGQRLEILRWSHTLDNKQKAGLQEIMGAWAEAKAEKHYKVLLGVNLEWLEKARSRLGLDVEKWLYPPEQEVTFDGRAVRLAVAADPFQIFLMGSYFDTCLALDKGSYRDTVLSNAYEANKQVLYAMDTHGVVLARKLVGITPGGEMVGFRTYLDSGTEAGNVELNFHIHAFCGTWAGTCGAGLSGVGVPERTSDLFWYNDGLEAWLPSAFGSYRVIVEDFATSRKPMRDLLKKHWTDCVRILQELGLWPIEEAETPEMLFSHRRSLAEELLAEVALDRLDLDLLNQIEGFVSTNGGCLQILKVRALIDPDQVVNSLQGSPIWGNQLYKMAEKIQRILALCEAETAFEKLLEEFIDDDGYMHGVSNVVFALKKRPARARKLRQRMTHWVLPEYDTDKNILTLLHTAETADSRTCSDNLICRLIYDPKHKKFFPDLAQWLPALKKPQRVLGNYLQAAWSNPRLNINDPNNQKEIHINLVVWCQRNPSAAATAFLRKHSDHHPDALLGLALADPLRYRVQIEKAAAKMAPTPALTIAVLMSHGREAGADFLATLSSYTEKPELVEKAIRLMEAIDALDWQAFAVAADYSDKQLHYCLPLIMRRIWDSLSEPAGTAGVDRLLSIDAARFLKDVGVNLYGLCLNVIAGLHRYDDQVSDNLCLGVRRLFFASGFNIPGEFRLWFNDLSGDRLFAANASDLDVYPETLWFEDPLFSDLYPLLFTKNGERRSVCRLPWINVEPFALPLLRQEASRFARLLVEKLDKPEYLSFKELEDYRTELELEELLIEQFKQKLEQENTKNGTKY